MIEFLIISKAITLYKEKKTIKERTLTVTARNADSKGMICTIHLPLLIVFRF
jgi:hypothetical protein